MKYTNKVYNALIEQAAFADGTSLTRKEIDSYPRVIVLDAYLTWEGIIGYTNVILGILGIEERFGL